MAAYAALLNLQRNKSINAIHEFVLSITTSNSKKRVLMPNQTVAEKKTYKEISKEAPSIVIIKDSEEFRADISKIIDSILNEKNADYYYTSFIKKCRKISIIIWSALLLGIISSIVVLSIKRQLDLYFFCFIVWILSCISLLITLTIIKKSWKNLHHGKKQKK